MNEGALLHTAAIVSRLVVTADGEIDGLGQLISLFSHSGASFEPDGEQAQYR